MNEHKDVSSNTSPKLKQLAQANFTLAFYKGAAVFLTQPLQVLIRYQQAALASQNHSQIISALGAARRIYSEKQSVAPFFRGTLPGAGKEILKNGLYKGALITGAPGLVDKLLQTSPCSSALSSSQYHFAQSGVAGLIAGFGDMVFGGSLESWATFRATSHGSDVKKNFWTEVRAEKGFFDKWMRAYRGAWATAAKGTVAYSTFFYTADPIKTKVAQAYNLPDKDKMPWYGDISAAILSGASVALTSSPLDIIKTQKQTPNPSKESIYARGLKNVMQHGISGLTAGLPLKFVMVTFGWAITNLVLQPHKYTSIRDNPREEEGARLKL